MTKDGWHAARHFGGPRPPADIRGVQSMAEQKLDNLAVEVARLAKTLEDRWTGLVEAADVAAALRCALEECGG